MSSTRSIDEFLKTERFKTRVQEADEYATKKGFDLWPTRIAWIGLSENVLVARRFAQRRSDYLLSDAWTCYTRLKEGRVFSEDPEGIFYNPSPRWESEKGTMEWFDTMVSIASGCEPPSDFPLGAPYEDDSVGPAIIMA